MRFTKRVCALSGLAMAIGCADSIPSTAPEVQPVTIAPRSAESEPLSGVGTFGIVEEISKNEKKFRLRQLGFEFQSVPGRGGRVHKDSLAVGGKHQILQVQIKGTDSTKIFRKGGEKLLDSLQVGDTVIVLGRVTGAALHADLVSDFTGAGIPVDSITNKLPRDTSTQVFTPDPTPSLSLLAEEPLSRCFGHSIVYGENIHEFQGCWGGPMQSGVLNTPFIPVLCPIIGCFGIDYLSYTVALGGWGYAFPFKFIADAPGLTYHKPGSVALRIEPQPVPETQGFSFSGGIGFAFGVNVDFCSFWGCYDVHTIQISELSMIHQSTEAGPLEPDKMDIGEAGCPGVGFLDFLAIGLCEDLGLNGKPFNTLVRSVGAASPSVYSWREFKKPSQTVTLRPDAMQVSMRFSDFDWRPGMTMGLAFELEVLGVSVLTTPTIPFGEVGLFDAITSPFPYPEQSIFTLARSTATPPTYYYQPTLASVNLQVQPAQASLNITSGHFLTEGTPVTVRLTESYDGSAIVGQPIVIQADGLGGTASGIDTVTTGSGGIATLVIPVGEYNITARFLGAEMYLPSSDAMTPVYVYRPTTFVIWGGSLAGVPVASRHQFWGSGWAKQVGSNGTFDGNSSFQGFAIPNGSTWTSPPASSGHGPESVPDLIGVIVTTQIEERGSRAAGNVAGHAVLRVDSPASYQPNGGHAATGVVRALLP